MPLLFSYGTLQLESVQLGTFGRLLEGSRDELPGYELSMLEIGDADVVATSGRTHHPLAMPSDEAESRVAGMVFEITDDELARPTDTRSRNTGACPSCSHRAGRPGPTSMRGPTMRAPRLHAISTRP